MSTFDPKTPEPGWKTRWPREALGLMLATPHVLVAVLVGVIGIGWIRSSLPSDMTALLVNWGCVVFVASPLIAWVFHALGKGEGYVQGAFQGYQEAMALLMKIMTGITLFLLAIWIALPEGEPLPTREQTLDVILADGMNSLFGAFVLGFAGMFRHLTIGMVGYGAEQNEIISRKAHDKLTAVFPKVTISLLLFHILFVNVLPGVIGLPIQIFTLYLIYVAGREIIGGITGNKQTQSKTVEATGMS